MKHFLYLIVSLFFLVSCSNQENVSSLPKVEKKGGFETFAIFGDVHNTMLKEADLNFNEPSTTIETSTKEDAINCVLEFHKSRIEKLPLSNDDKLYVAKGLETYKDLYDTELLMSQLQTKSSKSVDKSEDDVTTEDIKSLIQEAYTSGGIDAFEYNTFMQLVEYVIANASGKLSNSDFENRVATLINQWNIKYSDVDFSQLEIEQPNTELPTLDGNFESAPKGALGGVVLNVSQSSLKYWDDTPKTRAVPAFVGADIAGAVIGACWGSIGSKVNSGKVSWKGVAWSAATGAITASTGIVGKVGKWITKFLNKI